MVPCWSCLHLLSFVVFHSSQYITRWDAVEAVSLAYVREYDLLIVRFGLSPSQLWCVPCVSCVCFVDRSDMISRSLRPSSMSSFTRARSKGTAVAIIRSMDCRASLSMGMYTTCSLKIAAAANLASVGNPFVCMMRRLPMSPEEGNDSFPLSSAMIEYWSDYGVQLPMVLAMNQLGQLPTILIPLG